MNCSKCGAANDGGVKFCSNCGNDLTTQVIGNGQIQENNNLQGVQQIMIDNSSVVMESPIQTVTSGVNGVQPMIGDQVNNAGKKSVNKKIFIIGGIVLAGIVFIILAIFVLNLIFGNKDASIEEIKETNSFFLKDVNGNYAMFNEDGKRLTDFEFSSVDIFVNGATTVKNSNNEIAIIKDNGKYVTKFGEYAYIYQENGLYKATDKKYTSYLLDSNGKKVTSLDKKSIIDYSSSYIFVILKSEDKYEVVNYDGKTILKFDRAENEEKTPTINAKENYASIFYNNKTYILDIVKGKKVLDFESSKHFCVSSVNEENPDKLILGSCTTWSESQDTYDFKVVNKKKVLYEKNNSSCRTMSFEGNNVICNNNDGKFILDDKGNQVLNTSNVVYVDSKTYAKMNDDTNVVEFYENGKLKKSVDCLKLNSTGYNKDGIYTLRTYYSSKCGTTSGMYQLFKKDGTPLNDEKYRSSIKFGENGIAIVTKEYNAYYLINTKGEKISGEYRRISASTSDYYIVEIDDNIEAIINTKGKEIVKASDIEIVEENDKFYAELEISDKEYKIYDIDKKKDIVTLDSEPRFYEHYFTTTNDSKTQYYSYKNGKMFHEV